MRRWTTNGRISRKLRRQQRAHRSLDCHISKWPFEAHIVEFNADKGFVLVQAKAWRNQEETEPAGVDYAFGYREAYNPNMKRWFVEDTVTSALMRVMALVMGGTEKATKETMEQVKVNDATKPVEHDYWTTKFGDVPSYKTAAEAEQSGIPSLDHRWMRLPSNWVVSLYKRHRNAHMGTCLETIT
jgi:hypothetical protein